MSRLSKLEFNALNMAYKGLLKIKESHERNSDSICDVIFDQIDLKVEDDDKKPLEVALEHFKLMMERSAEAEAAMSILVSHFCND